MLTSLLILTFLFPRKHLKTLQENEIFTSLSAARSLLEQKQHRPLLLVEDSALEDFTGTGERQRERQRDRETERQRERDREREGVRLTVEEWKNPSNNISNAEAVTDRTFKLIH